MPPHDVEEYKHDLHKRQYHHGFEAVKTFIELFEAELDISNHKQELKDYYKTLGWGLVMTFSSAKSKVPLDVTSNLRLMKSNKHDAKRQLQIRQSHRVSVMYPEAKYKSSWENQPFDTDLEVAGRNLSFAEGGNIQFGGRQNLELLQEYTPIFQKNTRIKVLETGDFVKSTQIVDSIHIGRSIVENNCHALLLNLADRTSLGFASTQKKNESD